MMHVITPGLQTTLQGAPRKGTRHMGIPWAGPADAWSMALANRLVGNAPDQTALEITYGGYEACFESQAWIALTGAMCEATLDGETASYHHTLNVPAGSTLKLGSATTGARTYLAIAGGFEVAAFLGSASTYMPAGLGGYDGRALRARDVLRFGEQPKPMEMLQTPEALRPNLTDSFALRACDSAETHLLSSGAHADLFGRVFTAGRQGTRMGLTLEGKALAIQSDGKMPSAAVFPGAIQCPEHGTPIVLLADAQTTGGYPRIAHIARCDRHMLGQIRPGNSVRLLKRSSDDARVDYLEKLALLRRWYLGAQLY